MNNDLTFDLMRDHLLQVAAVRRRRRIVRGVAALAVPVCLAVLFMRPAKTEPAVTEAPPVIEEAPAFVTISTEDELLDALAHLGPVIVTREDGTEWLYLTNQ